MPASIFGDRFYGFREPAWHGLGTVFTDHPTATEAFLRAKLDYTVYATDLMAVDPATSQFFLTGKRALVRDHTDDDPNPRFFGMIGSQYEIIQNMEIAETLDPLVDTWSVETVGALGEGETVFVTLDAGEMLVKRKDLVKNYFLVTDTKNGGTALTIAFTPVRVVCQNTLSVSLSATKLKRLIRHGQGAKMEFDWYATLIADMQKTIKTTESLFNRMAKVTVDENTYREVIEAVYPEPVKPRKPTAEGTGDFALRLLSSYTRASDKYEADMALHKERIEGLQFVYAKFNDEQPDLANTQWALYNSVVELEDYRKGRGTQALASALFGDRYQTKKNAFSLISGIR